MLAIGELATKVVVYLKTPNTIARENMLRPILAGFFGFVSAFTVTADVVQLKDGSSITGTIKGAGTGKLTIETKYAGTLQLPLEAVTSMTSEKELFVNLGSGSVLKGKVSDVGGKLRVTTVNGVIDVSGDTVANVWAEGGVDPRIPAAAPERSWKYGASVNISGRSGNSENFGSYATFDATLDSDKDRLKFYGRGGRADDGGNTTVKEIIGGIDYEANFTDLSAWYVRGELEYDEIEGLDLRSTAAFGLARYLMREDDTTLRLRAGFNYRHESYANGTTDSKPGVDFGLAYRNDLWDWGKWSTDFTLTPSFEDFSDYRAYQESKLILPLGGSKAWSLQLGLSHEYNSITVAGRDKLDTMYFLRLGLNWE
jgi:hypothetical protein